MAFTIINSRMKYIKNGTNYLKSHPRSEYQPTGLKEAIPSVEEIQTPYPGTEPPQKAHRSQRPPLQILAAHHVGCQTQEARQNVDSRFGF